MWHAWKLTVCLLPPPPAVVLLSAACGGQAVLSCKASEPVEQGGQPPTDMDQGLALRKG